MDRRQVLLFTAAIPVAVLVGPGTAFAQPDPGPDDGPPLPAPPLTLSFEPIEGGDAVYLLLAPSTAQDEESAKLVLRVLLTNTGAANLTITGISFAFPGGGVPTIDMQGVDVLLGDGGVLTPGQQKFWHNGTVTLADDTTVKNQVYLSVPVPPTVRVRIFAAGYAAPAQFTAALAPYEVAHRLPFDVADLRTAECVSAKGDHWANGGSAGGQIYAHDVGIVGWDNATDAWSGWLPGKDGTKNEHSRAWNLPVRAVADGVVIDASDGMDDNTVLGQFPDPTPNPAGGNYVWIGHPDGTRTYYTHLRKGTVTVQDGDQVVAGQIIGRLGNSGNSTGPHIHIEVRKYQSGSPLRPWALADAWMVERSAGTPWDPNSNLWVPSENRGIPNVSMLIWPTSRRPGWYRAHIPEFIEIDFPPHEWWRVLRNAIESGYEPAYLDVANVDGRALAHALFRPAGAAPTQSRVDLTAAEFTAESAAMARDGYRPVGLTSYVGDGVRYGGVWRRENGPEWTETHGLGLEEHRTRSADLARRGFVPVTVSVVSVLGVPQVSATYVASSVSVDAPVWLTASALSTAIADNARAGRSLVHVSAASGSPARYAAVFQTGAATSVVTGVDRAALIDGVRDRAAAGEAVQTVAGYEEEGEERFVVAWRRA